MNQTEFINLLTKAFDENGMAKLFDQSVGNMLYDLHEMLVETNKTTNLTAITNPEDVILKHFIDSITISKHIPENSTVIDVGCGAGFPSLPLAIVRKDLAITSLDSTGKKIDFVKKASDQIGLSNINAVNARAEEYIVKHREEYDVCTSRAVARLNILSELCLPFVKTGGFFIAMKSNKAQEEYEEAKSGIKKLGGSLAHVDQFSLAFANVEKSDREIYCFKKTAKTPIEFPRKYAQILKKPI